MGIAGAKCRIVLCEVGMIEKGIDSDTLDMARLSSRRNKHKE
jgi:hypothetical protein